MQMTTFDSKTSTTRIAARTTVVAAVVSVPWILLGHYLLVYAGHSGGPLLWIAEFLLLPDLLLTSLLSDDARHGVWVLVLLLDFLYVWVLLFAFFFCSARIHRNGRL